MLRRIKRYLRYAFEYLKTFAFRHIAKTKMSRGEAMINSWLSYSDVNYTQQYLVKVPKEIRKSGNCFIDFLVTKGNTTYAIEYNGRQHYEYVPFFHKHGIIDLLKQQTRDTYIENWCKEQGYIFVEIPYNWSDDQIIAKLKEITE